MPCRVTTNCSLCGQVMDGEYPQGLVKAVTALLDGHNELRKCHREIEEKEKEEEEKPDEKEDKEEEKKVEDKEEEKEAEEKEDEKKALESEIDTEIIYRDNFYNREVINVAHEYIDGLRKQNLAKAG